MRRRLRLKAAYPGKKISTLEEVDLELSLAAVARSRSENDFLVKLQSFWLDFPPPPGSNPWSQEYNNHWRLVYEKLVGKKYKVDNEFFDFDIDYHVLNPYPFCTKDYRIVSNQLIAIGNIINSLALKPGASILEMGAGWGNTSLWLAAMGYKVTVIDINQKYGELIGRRASGLGVSVDFKCMAYDESVYLNQKFDCVLFFESFHHSYDHQALLSLIPSLLSRGGILALANEPLNENLPYAWGLNPAGEALWQIRTHGWYELVFRESYLLDALHMAGFNVKKYEPYSIFICRLSD